MKNLISVLDFDQVYHPQTYFKNTNYQWINLLDVEHTNSYCEEEALLSIKDRLKQRKNRGVTFIGSGNYHYVTYLLMAEIQSPFTLVLFDHHTDMMSAPSDSILTCGSWVMRSLEFLSMLKKVIIIGTRDDLTETIPADLNRKVSVVSEEQVGSSRIEEYVKSSIETKNVYVSIDKDVLNQSEALTNWDQGNMRLSQIFSLMEQIAINKRICGVDVCGEYPYNAAERFSYENCQAIRVNDRTNSKILKEISQLGLQVV